MARFSKRSISKRAVPPLPWRSVVQKTQKNIKSQWPVTKWYLYHWYSNWGTLWKDRTYQLNLRVDGSLWVFSRQRVDLIWCDQFVETSVFFCTYTTHLFLHFLSAKSEGFESFETTHCLSPKLRQWKSGRFAMFHRPPLASELCPRVKQCLSWEWRDDGNRKHGFCIDALCWRFAVLSSWAECSQGQIFKPGKKTRETWESKVGVCWQWKKRNGSCEAFNWNGAWSRFAFITNTTQAVAGKTGKVHVTKRHKTDSAERLWKAQRPPDWFWASNFQYVTLNSKMSQNRWYVDAIGHWLITVLCLHRDLFCAVVHAVSLLVEKVDSFTEYGVLLWNCKNLLTNPASWTLDRLLSLT